MFQRELGLQSVNWGDLDTTSESSASQSLLTQSLVASSHPIGQEVTAATSTSNRELETVDNFRNVQQSESGKKEETVDKTSCEEKNSDPTLCNEHKQTTQRLDQNDEKDRKNTKKELSSNLPKPANKGNSEIKNKILLSDDSNLVSNTETAASKRGSLDLFDSPDRVENVVSNKLNGINIEEKYGLLSTRVEKAMQQLCSATGVDQKTECEREHIGNVDNQPHLESKSEERSVSKRASSSSADAVAISCSQQNNKNPSVKKLSNESSLFFSSPLPNDSRGSVDKISFLDELDANFGGEGLLELSSFIADVEDKDDVFEGDINLLDVNVAGEHSFLEMSSIVSETGNKRKRSVGETYSAKRMKGRLSLNQIDNKISGSEVQVANVSSTEPNACVQKSIQRFADENLSNPTAKHNSESKHSNAMEGTQSSSFDLELSHGLPEDGFLCDSKINIDSEISDIFDCDNVSLRVNSKSKNLVDCNVASTSKNVNSGKSSIFNDSLNIDSKLNELFDVRTSVMIKEAQVKEESKLNVANFNESKDNGASSASCSEGVNIVSKLNFLIDAKTEKVIAHDDGLAFSSFTLNLNTQVCGILDQVNHDKKPSVIKQLELTSEPEKQLEESNFNVDTQLCNVLDNLNGSSKENSSKHANAVLSETMEIEEIQNLNFDEDTVFGTPQIHLKSMPFKSFAKNKRNPKNLRYWKAEKAMVHDQFSLKNEENNSKSNINQEDKLKSLEYQRKQTDHHDLVQDKATESSCLKPSSSSLVKNVTLEKDSHKPPSSCKTETIPESSTEGKSKQSAPVCSLITDSFLEGAFETLLNQDIEEVADDEVISSQKAPVTPHKSLRER